MRLLCVSILGSVSLVKGEFYSSFSSSSYSSSYSNINGEEHSESSAEEQYAERDSKGLNRRGAGRIRTENGNQVYEKTEVCDGDTCESRSDSRRKRLPVRSLRLDI